MSSAKTVLIVDDEPLARDRLRDLVAARDDVTVVGDAASGEAAVRDVARLAPEIILLDVQMPGMDGFDVVEALADLTDESRMPFIIFVTAYEGYAVRAFEVSAIDYLRKPVSRARLDEALDRAIDRIELTELAAASTTDASTADAADRARATVDALRRAAQTPASYPSRFVVRRGDQLQFITPDDIDWIDAAGNYVRLHVRGAACMLRTPLGAFEGRLDPQRFVRVHRSAIVNLDRVRKIEPFAHGEYVLLMSDGVRLRSSRAHSARLRAIVRTGIG